MEPSPTFVLRDVGCPEELSSPVSFPVPAGISKIGCIAFGSCRQNHVGKAVIGPLPRSVVGRNGAVVLIRDGSHANVLGPNPRVVRGQPVWP